MESEVVFACGTQSRRLDGNFGEKKNGATSLRATTATRNMRARACDVCGIVLLDFSIGTVALTNGAVSASWLLPTEQIKTTATNLNKYNQNKLLSVCDAPVCDTTDSVAIRTHSSARVRLRRESSRSVRWQLSSMTIERDGRHVRRWAQLTIHHFHPAMYRRIRHEV